ncbi:MAG: hypothetical protein EHM28_07845 [Spirochaetaceae bacterium]|nr:MAG: hypothetical protein EHM28_07845 [Spirochaetaceae bacterium]
MNITKSKKTAKRPAKAKKQGTGVKRVLICIGDAAGGHISAANAMIAAFAKLAGKRVQVTVKDLFTEAKIAPFNNAADVYIKVNKNRSVEWFYNVGVWLFNRFFFYPVYRAFLLVRMGKASKSIIDSCKPDLVISNNAIVAPIMERLKKDGATWKSAVLVTDIAYIFRGWADRSADIVISPTREASVKLHRYGVAEKTIRQPLFPINPALEKYRPRVKVLSELGFALKGRKTVLVTSGGFGVLALKKALDTLMTDGRLQIIVLAGRVDEYRKILALRYANNPRVKVLGFVANIQDYYNAADIIVGKPGPATLIEIELFRKKAVFTKHVGGQEKGNVDYALRNRNFRSIGGNWHLLKRNIDELLDQKNVPISERRYFNECELIVKELLKLLK